MATPIQKQLRAALIAAGFDPNDLSMKRDGSFAVRKRYVQRFNDSSETWRAKVASKLTELGFAADTRGYEYDYDEPTQSYWEAICYNLRPATLRTEVQPLPVMDFKARMELVMQQARERAAEVLAAQVVSPVQPEVEIDDMDTPDEDSPRFRAAPEQAKVKRANWRQE